LQLIIELQIVSENYR